MLCLGKHLGVALTVKKNAYGLFFVSALLFSVAAGLLLVDSAKANAIPYSPPAPFFSINADGSVTPETDLISRNGNVYALTADVNEYEIQIARSNAVFDGDGHTIHIATAENSGIYVSSYPGRLTNVTIKNIEIITVYNAILLFNCSHCHITGIKTSQRIKLSYSDYNTITESTAQIRLSGSSSGIDPNNNVFFRNNITKIVFMGVKSSVASNIFYKNNMLLDEDNPPFIPSLVNKHNFWDNGSVGNYWSDYLAKYPNASEIGNTGIGDTPYVIDEDNIDYHPLMCPYDIESDAIAFPPPEPFPTTLVIASVVAVAIVSLVLIVYFKKRKH
jgi:hypothetical protein